MSKDKKQRREELQLINQQPSQMNFGKLTKREQKTVNTFDAKWFNITTRLTCLKELECYEELASCTNLEQLYDEVKGAISGNNSVTDVYAFDKQLDRLIKEIFEIEICVAAMSDQEQPLATKGSRAEKLHHNERLRGMRELMLIAQPALSVCVKDLNLMLRPECATLKVRYQTDYRQSIEEALNPKGRQIQYHVSCVNEIFKALRDEEVAERLQLAE